MNARSMIGVKIASRHRKRCRNVLHKTKFRWSWGRLVALVLLLVAISGCSTAYLPFSRSYGAHRLWKDFAVLNRAHTGVCVYDPLSQKVLFSRKMHHHFTPASNTKIYTLYVAREVLGDSAVGLIMKRLEDTTVIRGVGYPLEEHDLLRWLDTSSVVIDCTDTLLRFGAGWMWDDYPYSYQRERSWMPLYGNAVKVVMDSTGTFYCNPTDTHLRFVIDTALDGRYFRAEYANVFYVNPRRWIYPDTVYIPLFAASAWRRDRFERTFSQYRWLENCPQEWLADVEAKRLPLDTLYKRMMYYSDNFIAEQLLLMTQYAVCGEECWDSTWTYLRSHLLKGLPDSLHWVDGSGLSRYNQTTPANTVWVLEQIWHKWGQERALRWMAAPGRVGTLRHRYRSLVDTRGEPLLYAKTGSLRGVYCLSGYLRCRSGRWLIFSVMVNHLMAERSLALEEIERFLRYWQERY